MSILFSRRLQRATVWVVLLAWLFAIGAGIANACLLEPQQAHGHPSAAGVKVAHGTAVSAGHRLVRAGDGRHDDDDLASKAPCLKVCDETSQTLVSEPTVPPLDASYACLAVWSTWPAFTSPPGVVDRSHHRTPAAPEQAPLRLQYARLAL